MTMTIERRRSLREARVNIGWTLLFAGLVGLTACPGAATAAPASTPQRIVYHISEGEPERQSAALRSLQNLINALGPGDWDLRAVVHGEGVSLLLLPEAKSKVSGLRYGNAVPEMRAHIDRLRAQGVRFEVCGNTLRRHAIDPDRHLYRVDPGDIVRSGLMRLATLQSRGYVYIKP